MKILLRCFAYVFIAAGLVVALWSPQYAILFMLLAIVCFLPSVRR